MDERTRRRAAPRRGRALLDGLVEDAHTATDALLAAVGRGRLTPEEAFLKVLTPAAAEAGERWARDEWGVATANRAVAAIEHALVAISHTHAPRDRDRGRVLMAVVDGDEHTLPARLFGAALTMRRWKVDVLTAPLSAGDLTACLADLRPRALLLSCTMRPRLPGAAGWVQAAHDEGVPVVAGGAAFGSSPRRAAVIGADAWASSLDGVERILETPREPRRYVRRAVPVPDAGDDLDRVLAEAWAATLRAEHDPAKAAWLCEWVPLVLRSARAAVVTDDDEVLVEDLLWLSAATARRFRDRALVAEMLAPLRRLVPASDVRLHGMLATAGDRLDAARLRPVRRTPSAPQADGSLRPHPAAVRGREEPYDELAFVASVTCGARMALVAVADHDRMVVKGAYGVDPTDYEATGAWAADVFVADAGDADDGAEPAAAHPFAARHEVAFLAQVPIRGADGAPAGAVIVADPQPKTAAWPQRQALRALARQAEAQLRAGDDAVVVDGDELDAVPADLRARLGATAEGDDQLLRTSQVARLFHVSPRTVNNWVAQGRLTAIATAGGHKRYRLGSVLALYREQAAATGESSAH